MARKCPKGQILRKAFTKKSGVKVAGACIKDRGLPGKGKRLFTLRKGTLSKYGYKTSFETGVRHAALRKAVSGESYATVVRKLNAVAILQKRTNPKVHNILRGDMAWVQNNLR
jgi:hypothetical protein